MRLSGLAFLFSILLIAGAPESSKVMAQPYDAGTTQTQTAPEGGFADDGGTGFHGLKTLDAPLHETEGPIVDEATATTEQELDAAHGEHDAAAGHGDAHAGEHKKGLPQFDPSSFPSQIFWLVVMFVIMYAFFSKKTLPEIGRVLQKRQAHIEHDIATAQRLRGNAEEAKGRYERAVAEAQDKSTKLFLKAEEEVKAKMASGLEEFKSRSALQIKDTEESIEKAKKEAMDSIQSIAAEIASVAAEKIVGVSTDIDQAKNVVRNINKKAA
jgi:F-type H+-transporting ATPase subunit b